MNANTAMNFDLDALANPTRYEDFMALIAEGIEEAKRINAHFDAMLEELGAPLPA